jgi:Putative transposase of IS4/5 family (DUF4096)
MTWWRTSCGRSWSPCCRPLPRPPYGGRHRTISDRNCFAAIVFMARTSTPWRLLPARELGAVRPATCWRRLMEWTKAGVFEPAASGGAGPVGRAGPAGTGRGPVWTPQACGPSVGGPRWRKTRRSWQAWEQAPPGLRRWWAAADRRGHRRQRQRHQHVRGGPGRRPADPYAVGPSAHPTGKIHADKAYDSGANRAYLRRRGIRPRIARCGIESSLGTWAATDSARAA